jgi:predicted secreted protein
MTLVFAFFAILWWIAIWGLFDIATKNYTDEQRVRLYFLMIGIIIVFVCFFPDFLYHI